MTDRDLKPENFAVERLRELRRTPEMWAYTREAFAAQVALLLELLDVDPRALVAKALQVTGLADRIDVTCSVQVFVELLTERVHDDWARALIDEAVKLAGLEL